jgi:uncharacterized membrane protein YjgN (DUF898 family)
MYKVSWNPGHLIWVAVVLSCIMLLAITELFSLVGEILLLTRLILAFVPYLLPRGVPPSVRFDVSMTSLPVLRCMVCYFMYFRSRYYVEGKAHVAKRYIKLDR